MHDPDPESLLLIGRVWRPHGVQGTVKVVPESDDPERLLDLETVYLGPDPERATPYDITQARMQYPKKGPLLLFDLKGVEGRDAAEALRQLQVYAPADDLPLADDEYFLHDLIGLSVVTTDGEAIGTIRDVMDLPSHPIAVVGREGKPDVLIPAVPAFIETLDWDAGRVAINPIEGLID